MISKVLCGIVFLMALLLPSCSLLMPNDPTPVATTPAAASDWGYEVTLSVTTGGTRAPLPATEASNSDVTGDLASAGGGIIAMLQGFPIIGGLIFGVHEAAGVAKEASKSPTDGSTDGSATTPQVLRTLAESGAVFTYKRSIVWKQGAKP